MNGKSDETLSRKSEERTSSHVEPIFGLFRVRSDSQSDAAGRDRSENSRDREPACKPASLGR